MWLTSRGFQTMPTDSVLKARLLLSSLLMRPAETYDRLYLQLTDRWHIRAGARRTCRHPTEEWARMLGRLSSALNSDLESFIAERGRIDICDQVVSATEEKLKNGPFRQSYNGDRRLADLCYAACRAL